MACRRLRGLWELADDRGNEGPSLEACGMKLAIMQPYFFPYLGYFQLIHSVDRFIMYDNLNYIKRGWISRNRILINGAPAPILVPVKARSSYAKIRDIRIDNAVEWRRKTLRLLEHYGRAPFFDEIFPLVERSISSQTESLAELNKSSIKLICQYLQIRTEIVTDASNYDPLEHDLAASDSETHARYLGTQGLSDTKTIRVLCICKAEGATTFINAIGGQALYDKQVFARNGFGLFFVQTLPYSYQQKSPEFYPSMSIIDVLMNCGRDGTQQLLRNCELV